MLIKNQTNPEAPKNNLRATGLKTLPIRDDGACPLLDPRTARCLIYESRPFGCRTHFCQPAGGPHHHTFRQAKSWSAKSFCHP